MHQPRTHARADVWIEQIFSAKAVEKAAVFRSDVRWIEREIDRDLFLSEVRKRGSF